jgi:type IV secretion system protein VirB9
MRNRFLLAAAFSTVLISHAHAAQTPRAGSLDSRVTSVVYQPNNVVKISATYGISTMIIFDEMKNLKPFRLATQRAGRLLQPKKETSSSLSRRLRMSSPT